VDPEEISFLWFLFYIQSGHGLLSLIEVKGAQAYRLKEGAQTISQRMALSLKNVYLSSPVTEITRSSSSSSSSPSSSSFSSRMYTITTPSGSYKTKYIIMANPPCTHSRIKFNPPLPPHRIQLQQRLSSMGYFTKVICIYQNSFWRNQGWSGEAVSWEGPITLVFDTCSEDWENGVKGSYPSLTAFLTR